MPIIKDKQISENTWAFIADELPLSEGDITVSLARWLQDKDLLLKRAGKIGIRLTSNDQLEKLGNDITGITLIELDFPHFSDGRLFSHARLLRGRLSYDGEIRAVGNYLADQVFYLHRVGVDGFEFSNPKDMQVALAALNDFSVRYQASTN